MKTQDQPKINLLYYRQEETRQKRRLWRKVVIIAVVTILLVAIGAKTWWSQNQQLQALENQNRQLNEQVGELNRAMATAGGVGGQELKELDSRRAHLAELERERRIDLDQMKGIYEISVEKITIDKMDINDKGEITINAYTNSHNSLIELVEKLQQEDYIQGIQFISAQSNSKTGEISFTLVAAGEVAGK